MSKVKMGTVWDRTADFLSDNGRAILPIALLGLFLPAAIEGNFEALMARGGMVLTVVLRGVQVVFGVVTIWSSLALTALALDMVGEGAGEGGAAALATRRLPAALVVSLVMLAAMLVALVPVPLYLIANGVDLVAIAERGEFSIPPAVGWVVALYLFVLAALILWLGARLIVTNAVIVRDGRTFAALGRSWELTRGVALPIVGVLLLYVFVSFVAGLAAQTVFGSVFALIAGSEGQGVTPAGVLTAITVAAVQAGFQVIAAIFTAKLYQALAARAALGQTIAL